MTDSFDAMLHALSSDDTSGVPPVARASTSSNQYLSSIPSSTAGESFIPVAAADLGTAAQGLFGSGGDFASTTYDTSSAGSLEIRATVQSNELIYLGNEELRESERRCISLIGKFETKWCYAEGCKLNTHKNYSGKLQEGIYIKDTKVRGKTAFCVPFVPASLISDEQLSVFMRASKSTAEWRMMFDTINNARVKIDTVKGIDEEQKVLAQRVAKFRTPVKSSLRDLSRVKTDFEDEGNFEQNVDSVTGKFVGKESYKNTNSFDFKSSSVEKREELRNNSGIPVELLDAIFSLEDAIKDEAATCSQISGLEQSIAGLRGDVDTTMAKVLYTAGVVGDPNKAFEEPNLCAQAGTFKEAVDRLEKKEFDMTNEVSSLGQRILFLEAPKLRNNQVSQVEFEMSMGKILKLFEMYSKKNSALNMKFNSLKLEVENFFASKTPHHTSKVASKTLVSWDTLLGEDGQSENEIVSNAVGQNAIGIKDRKRACEDQSTQPSLVNSNGVCCEGCDCREDIKRLKLEIGEMQVSMAKLHSKEEGGLIEIAGVLFKSYEDTAAWAELNLPSGLPFGCFVDVYSFLERVSPQFSGGLKEFESQFKLGVSGDEAATLMSFLKELPRVFGGSIMSSAAAVKCTKKSFISTLPTASDWESPNKLGGLKPVMKSRMKNVRLQITKNIGSRLAGYPLAKTVALATLLITTEFLTALMNYMSDTLLELTIAGFSTESAWQLVTQLVNHIFSDALDGARSFVRDGMTMKDERERATTSMWATFRTIGVMQDYQAYNIENHPSISGEYTRFLIANWGGKDGTDEVSKGDTASTLGALEDKVEAVKKIALGAKAASSTASNRLEELKRKNPSLN